MSVHVGVNLSDEQYRVVARVAGERGVQAHTLLEQLVTHALRPSPEQIRAQQRKDVLRLHGTGRTDRLIAENLGIPRSTVSAHRNALHLPPHDRRGRRAAPRESTPS